MSSPGFSGKLRWFLFALLGLLLAAIVLAEVLPWNFLKVTIAERVQAATGRSLTIEGDITVNLLPQPQISARNISLGNPEWATADAMTRIESISAEPALGPLLRGQVALGRVEIESPRIYLENRASGGGNWSFNPIGAVSQPRNRGQSALPVTLDHLQVTEAVLSYCPAGDDESPIIASVPSISLTDDRETIRADATVTIRNRSFRLEAVTDSLDDLLDESLSFHGNVSVTSDDSQFATSLVLPESPSLSPLEADPALEIQNPAAWAEWLSAESVDMEAVTVAAQLERHQSRWALTDIDAVIMDSHITGELALDMSGQLCELTGRLHAPQFDIAELRAALPWLGPPDRPGFTIPVLPELRGRVSLAIDRLVFEPLVASDFEAQLHFGRHEIGLAPFRFAIAEGRAEGRASLTSNPDVVAADTKLRLTDLAIGAMGGTAGQTEGRLDADLELAFEAVPQQQNLQPSLLLEHLQVQQAEATYSSGRTETRLKALVEVTGAGAPVIVLTGNSRGHPVEGKIEGAPLIELAGAAEDYPVGARVSSAGLHSRLETHLASILDPQTLSAQLHLIAESTRDLEPWLGHVLPPIEHVRLAGTLNRDRDEWSLTELEAQAGETSLTGAVHFYKEERPRLQADLEAERIDLSAFLAPIDKDGGDKDRRDQGRDARSRAPQRAETNILALLSASDAQFELSAAVVDLPESIELRDFTMNASLAAAQAETQVFQFVLAGGSVSARLALDASQNPTTGRIDADFEDVVLSRLGETFTPLEERLGSLSGALRLELTQTQAGKLRDDLLLPYIGRVKMDVSSLRLHNPEAQTDLRLQLQTQGLSQADQVLHVDGEGFYDGEPVSVRFRGDPLLNARHVERPYGIDLDAKVVNSNISLQGTILRPFSLEGLDLKLAMEGPNPQELSLLFGVPLPPLPPYMVSGNLLLKQERWTLTNLVGHVGESDIAGWLGFDPTVSPPRYTGDLKSESLYLRDLGSLIGAAPRPEDEDTGPVDQILPDEPIIGDAWRSVSADVRYRANSVRAMDTPFSKVAIDFLLDDGRGQFDPLSFGLGGGRVDFKLDLDATAEPPDGTAYVEIRRVDLREMLEDWDLADDSIGIVGGQGQFWVKGASVTELFGSADGGMVVLMTEGSLDALLVEVAGLDAGQAILSWLRNRGPVPIDCAYADIQAGGGVAEVDTFVVDTGDTLFTAGGEANLDNETLDLTIMAHPKDPSVLVGQTPLHLGGTFGDMEVGPARRRTGSTSRRKRRAGRHRGANRCVAAVAGSGHRRTDRLLRRAGQPDQ